MMNTAEIFRFLAVLAIMGSMSVNGLAQGVDFEQIKHVDKILLKNPIRLMPPPPPPPLDDEDDAAKIDDGFDTPDHDPSIYLTPDELSTVANDLSSKRDKDLEPVPLGWEKSTPIWATLKIYPNPAANYVIIDTALEDDVNIQLLDGAGRVLANNHIVNFEQKWRMDLSKYENGVYMIVVESKGQREVRPILISG